MQNLYNFPVIQTRKALQKTNTSRPIYINTRHEKKILTGVFRFTEQIVVFPGGGCAEPVVSVQL